MLVVGADQEGDAILPVHRPHQLEHPLGRLPIEISRRLVGQDKEGPVDQRSCDRDTLLLTARETRRPIVRAIGEAYADK